VRTLDATAARESIPSVDGHRLPIVCICGARQAGKPDWSVWGAVVAPGIQRREITRPAYLVALQGARVGKRLRMVL
jgi:hypothetical protein